MADCKEFQKMMEPFDRRELQLGDEEKFVKHIRDCADCREELEIHYIIQYGLGESEDFGEISEEYRELIEHFDFKGLVDLKLENSESMTVKVRQHNKNMKFCIGLSDLLLLLTMIILVIIKYF